MSRKALVKIEKDEKDIVQELYENINSLKSLLLTLCEQQLDLNAQEEFYQKLLIDWNNSNKKYNEWWNNMGCKYNLSKKAAGGYHLDFEQCIIYAVN